MSEKPEGKPPFQKGDRAAVVSGAKDLGVRGEVFWVGENKFGPGMRFGLRGDDGETYWVDEANIGTEADAPPAPEPPPPDESPPIAKGARVEITGGKQGKGVVGEVFWAGESKYGPGMRYGIRAADDETYWADGRFVKQIEAPAEAAGGGGGDGAPPIDDAPLPDPDEFADFADPMDEPPPDDIPF